ncbi:class A beta-lactamase [Pseudonocardia sp. T1-2H]|uniref:class A beta-lactamase n=1 Tax=Pseudonocardia sp. T1-2H TaxID=3128899 RepID=UPI0031013554
MMISRRSLLLTGAVSVGAALVGCAAPAAPTPAPRQIPIPPMEEIEQRYARRIGVHALDTVTGATAGHRDTERFLMCSTAKSLMAAFVLHLSTTDPGLLDRRVTYTGADLLEYAPITSTHLGTGMTVAELCAAAVTVSDNTAHNLLLRETGGPAALTAYLAGLGDAVTRADRPEPALNEPAGDQDTTTPAALAATLRTLTTGDALPAARRDQLVAWLRANTTGDAQIRAGVPAGWQVGDKTGSGFAGEKNDVGVLTPPQGAPIVLTVFTVPTDPDDGRGEEAVAATTRAALGALGGAR